MTSQPVCTLDDPRLDPYRALTVRDSVAADDFIVEGDWLVERLAKSAFTMTSVVCTDGRRDQVAAYVPADCPIYALPKDQINQLVGFSFHRGVLACAERPKKHPELSQLADAGDQGNSATLVAAEGIADPVNLGRLLRLSAAFGSRALVLSPRSADPLSRQALRVSMGAALTVPTLRADDFESSLMELKTTFGYRIVATTLRSDAQPLRHYSRHPKQLILFGGEGFGLSDSVLALADDQVTVEMGGEVDSINVADAAAIFLYELCYRQPL